MGLPLIYQFECSHGIVSQIAVNPPRFLYESGRASGAQWLTAYITDAACLTATRKLHFTIGEVSLHGPSRSVQT